MGNNFGFGMSFLENHFLGKSWKSKLDGYHKRNAAVWESVVLNRRSTFFLPKMLLN